MSLHINGPRNPDSRHKEVCALAVMTKVPRAGEVKTRLTPPLSPQEAAELNSCFLRDIAAKIERIASGGKARGIAVYTPVGAEKEFAEILPAEFELVPQRGVALGERLICATKDLLALGFGSVCLINSDSPTVPAQSFFQAVHFLSQHEDGVVLGPSDDGGYYLIGFNKLQPALFENIPWSTNRVLEQTRARARENGMLEHLLPTWYDVDDAANLRRLCGELFPDNPGEGASSAPATREYLANLLQKEGRSRIWPAGERST